MLSHFYCFLITAQGGSRLIIDRPYPPPYPTIPLSFNPALATPPSSLSYRLKAT